jgi:hypothetical protein
VRETNIGGYRPQGFGEIIVIVAQNRLGQSRRRRFDANRCVERFAKA